MEPTAPRLSMSQVRRSFGATVALDGVDLEVRAGEVHALIGENGAGKSTLMKVLSGALAPDAGELRLDGAPYAPRSPADGLARGVAMIYQELSLAPHLSATENILLGRLPARRGLVDWPGARSAARAALAEVGRDDIALDGPVARLSPAEAQLVEIARAVASRARVLVFDEPTSSLGGEDAQRLFALIRRLRERGTAIVYISHALEEVFALCDRYTVLRDGKSVAGGAVAGAELDAIVAAMVGRRVTELFPRSPSRPGAVVARVEGLAGTKLPRSASLEIRRGEVLGIAGLIGAGRTELLRALFGLDRVRAGELEVLALAGWRSPRARWRQGVGFVSEDRKREGLAVGLSVADNLCLPRLDRLGRLGFVAPRAVDAAAREWTGRLRIKTDSPGARVASLSGGNQQKVALARLSFADVDVLLLDEPTRGIDIGSKAEIYRRIDELARGASSRGQCAVVVVSSYLPELLGVCDRIAVMSRGRLGPARDRAELDEHALLREMTGGAR